MAEADRLRTEVAASRKEDLKGNISSALADTKLRKPDIVRALREQLAQAEAGLSPHEKGKLESEAYAGKKLDVKEFEVAVKKIAGEHFTDADATALFNALDADGSGKIDGSEFLLYSLLNAMIMCKSRLIDMFKVWDEDSSGGVSEKEFTMAVDGMGFNAPDSVIKKLFAKFDVDKSGTLKYDELTEMLDKTVGVAWLEHAPLHWQLNCSPPLTLRLTATATSVHTLASLFSPVLHMYAGGR